MKLVRIWQTTSQKPFHVSNNVILVCTISALFITIHIQPTALLWNFFNITHPPMHKLEDPLWKLKFNALLLNGMTEKHNDEWLAERQEAHNESNMKASEKEFSRCYILSLFLFTPAIHQSVQRNLFSPTATAEFFTRSENSPNELRKNNWLWHRVRQPFAAKGKCFSINFRLFLISPCYAK